MHDAVVSLGPANVAGAGLHNGGVKVMLIGSQICSTDISKIDSHTQPSRSKSQTSKRFHYLLPNSKPLSSE